MITVKIRCETILREKNGNGEVEGMRWGRLDDDDYHDYRDDYFTVDNFQIPRTTPTNGLKK